VLLILVVLVGGGVGFLYLLPERTTRLALDYGRKSAGLVRKEITLSDGLHFVYLEGGQGEPLMLLHGFGANKDVFVAVAAFLTKNYRVIIPDTIGFGESAHPPQADYGPPAQAERLRALTQALGLSKVHLGGNSMGGQIALTYAALYSNEVSSLWLLAPAGVWSAPPSELQKIIAQKGANPLLVKSPDDFANLIAFSMGKPAFIPRPILEVLAQERIDNFSLEERIFPQIRAYSVEERVAGVTVPTLIVWGDGDRALHPSASQILQTLLPRSQVILMPGVGHLPMMEKPQDSVEDYLRFRSAATKR